MRTTQIHCSYTQCTTKVHIPNYSCVMYYLIFPYPVWTLKCNTRCSVCIAVTNSLTACLDPLVFPYNQNTIKYNTVLLPIVM